MRTLLLGSTGLLGQAVAAEIRRRGWSLAEAARSGAAVALDIADPAALAETLEAERPEMVVNCAALVDLSACESDPDRAWRINARPLAFLADWSKRTGGRLVHVSTDHWFASGGPRAHDENEKVAFANEYARTKFAGEAFALSAPLALVLRTSIVGIRGWDNPSFAEWAISAIESGQPMTLFADAFTSSIDTGSFARAALDLAERGAAGLVNLAAREVYSKEDFVRALARHLGLELEGADTGSAAGLMPPRPTSLGLDVARAQAMLGYRLPDLEQVVAAVVDQHRERRTP